MVEAILVACCEHSLASPSVDAVRFVASSGVPLQTAVAAGISSIGEWHGGAIEPCARLIKIAVDEQKSASAILADLKARNQRMPGFGHATHTHDPRSKVLLELASQWKIAGRYTQFILDIERATQEIFGRALNANVDGVIAGLMCDMNIDPALGKAFFIIGRSAGYCAHAHEQTTKERPFKAADFSDITYTGPARRDVPDAKKE
jgi:citrate synthase